MSKVLILQDMVCSNSRHRLPAGLWHIPQAHKHIQYASGKATHDGASYYRYTTVTVLSMLTFDAVSAPSPHKTSAFAIRWDTAVVVSCFAAAGNRHLALLSQFAPYSSHLLPPLVY